MDCIQSESKLVEQYRNLVEDFRRDLKVNNQISVHLNMAIANMHAINGCFSKQAEVDSLFTGDKEYKSTLTDNENVLILTHAYKKVIRVQMELAQCQVCNSQVPSEQAETCC